MSLTPICLDVTLPESPRPRKQTTSPATGGEFADAGLPTLASKFAHLQQRAVAERSNGLRTLLVVGSNPGADALAIDSIRRCCPLHLPRSGHGIALQETRCGQVAVEVPVLFRP